MRIFIDLTCDQTAALERLSKARKVSRANLLRNAVTSYLQGQSPTEGAQAFGAWVGAQEHDSDGDGLAYQQRLRSEW